MCRPDVSPPVGRTITTITFPPVHFGFQRERGGVGWGVGAVCASFTTRLRLTRWLAPGIYLKSEMRNV